MAKGAMRPRQVYFYATCVIDMMAPQAGVDAIELIRAGGIEVEFPRAQSCCGQPVLWLAAQAIEHRFTVLTGNAKGFKDIPGLRFVALNAPYNRPGRLELSSAMMRSLGAFARRAIRTRTCSASPSRRGRRR